MGSLWPPFFRATMNTQQAMQKLAEMKSSKEGLRAVYTEPGADGNIANITVWRGRSLLRLSQRHGGVRTQMEDNDFFTIRCRFLVGNPPVIAEPMQGATLDVVEEDGQTHRYIVQPPGPEEPCFRVIDSRTVIRIHTKSIRVIL